ncbi:alpha/beta hydrolase [Leptolyngbya sp. NK1-12]|uniref:Alpha/beta hydrolase n=1 Tax=Leptolyngbya sp. NK1-12 TaxID=2547451 RepID=A0AA96WHP0_9CYAN|nr:alpha/beta hydrolase [Leptolyngbya sp. NK1-12]WNZ25315.1 alpha/beta hydrolase [Leptolyngbya sp. NK1-12]
MFSSNRSLSRSEVLAYHGWGFDHSCWQGWQEWLEQQSCDLKTADRGYFDASNSVNCKDDLFKVIFVHSYGLHWCPVEQLNQADVLVIFSSFLEFHPEPPNLKKRSQTTIQQMLGQLSSDEVRDSSSNPRLMLQKFLTRSYHPIAWHGPIPETLNIERLRQDLQHLNIAVIDPAVSRSVPQVVVLHGSADRIVSATKGKALAEQLKCPYFEIPTAGHALPFTHAEHCQAILQPILNARLDP